MPTDLLSEILSSPNSLGIAALVSIRPRTQSELAELTGVSVPGVLKHLKRLEKLGLVQQSTLDSRLFRVRRVYTSRGISVGDFSRGDIRVVRLLRNPEAGPPSGDSMRTLESLAEDLIIQRRRIREQVRKLSRMIDDLLEDQARISRTAEETGRGVDERLILGTIFTEESVSDAERVLARHYGLKGGRRSIERVLAESRKIAKK
jgi:DNA-binding Lrp family transcriptional regulator